MKEKTQVEDIDRSIYDIKDKENDAYRMEDGLPCFTVLTRDAAAEIRFIHDRMPVMLSKDVIDDWISPAVDPKEVLRYSITDVVSEKAG